jgi:hypothetical protein
MLNGFGSDMMHMALSNVVNSAFTFMMEEF